jgi:hypothetical protein
VVVVGLDVDRTLGTVTEGEIATRAECGVDLTFATTAIRPVAMTASATHRATPDLTA